MLGPGGRPEHVEPTGWASVLPLEPGTEARGVKDVATGKPLATTGHLLPTYNTDIIGVG